MVPIILVVSQTLTSVTVALMFNLELPYFGVLSQAVGDAFVSKKALQLTEIQKFQN